VPVHLLSLESFARTRTIATMNPVARMDFVQTFPTEKLDSFATAVRDTLEGTVRSRLHRDLLQARPLLRQVLENFYRVFTQVIASGSCKRWRNSIRSNHSSDFSRRQRGKVKKVSACLLHEKCLRRSLLSHEPHDGVLAHSSASWFYA
jgi:hypothetical protein